MPELPRGLRWLMNTFAIAALLWTGYCVLSDNYISPATTTRSPPI